MKWKFIDTGFNSGKFNMNFDLQLASELKRDETVLRFYRWKPYCISLGANQPLTSINLTKTDSAGLEVVKRPTGGRAILHSEELTYAVVHPVTSRLSPKALYKEINLALKNGLEIYNFKLSSLNLEQDQPHFPSFYKEAKSDLCFAVSAKSEINLDGKKLVGSAQRKIGDVVLQHGSILCGTFHKNLIDYLKVSAEEKREIEKEINETTIELETIINSETDYTKLIQALKSGFERHFNISFLANKELDLVH
ncbi:MAG: hypothetical protein KJN64_11115 [Ignavibacteria bacterium]|nr:hypothetical protein [Ignavibacteria bacterium]MBT8380787.1 hypothetical protein [Ignavibacteria bacterium]MBT8392738.1 hypothetical protein [Ignavibacteria bacterium]NNL19704.1 lipoate--protein ligase family protein [Ignavibacteriaceae bacterium]